MPDPADPIFFPTPAALRAWLEEHHATARGLWVGFHRKRSGQPSITWPEAVDQALCYGWIDGVRRTVDADRYTIRFTPRSPRSTWSAVNVRRATELLDLGLMRPAGRRAFEARTEARTATYSYEQRQTAALDDADEARFRADPAAWAFFQAQPPGYRQTAIWWVVSAKRPETRQRRLASLIADSAQGRRIGQLTRPTRE